MPYLNPRRINRLLLLNWRLLLNRQPPPGSAASKTNALRTALSVAGVFWHRWFYTWPSIRRAFHQSLLAQRNRKTRRLVSGNLRGQSFPSHMAIVLAWLGYPKFGRSVSVGTRWDRRRELLWIGLAWAQRLSGLNEILGVSPRPGFNPWESKLIGSQNSIWNFIVIRMVGLSGLSYRSPREMFLRGFVMRFVVKERWWEVPFGTLNLGWTLWPVSRFRSVCRHLVKSFAAFVWFGLIQWPYSRTGNVWDCVIAHGVTNLVMGIYILVYKQWWLW